jgi:hypothetical protein
MKFWRWLGWSMMLAVTVARADYAEDLARIHVEAIGGRARVAALQTLRMTGTVQVGNRELRFELLAQRPNLVRVTTTGEGRTLIQAADGSSPPWRLEPEKSLVPHRMSGEEAVDFMAEAEFDDQLTDPAARGYQLDFGGETSFMDRRALKLSVTHARQRPFFLLLDAETYFIVGRVVSRTLPSGREVTVETRYGDFRPVEGVLLAHRIGIYAEGKLLHETALDSIEANPPVDEAVFTMPFAVGGPAKE